MSREFKRTFFTCLLVVLLVVSNLLCLKLTSFLDLTVAVSVFVFPFTFLCTLLILNMGGKSKAYQAIIIAALIQVFITISYSIAIKLGIQTEVPDMATQINEVFKVDEMNLLASIIAFITSNCALIYIYDNFKKCKQELYGIALGLLAALFINNIIYQILTLHDSELSFVINMLLSNIIVSIVMLIIITILFYILKEPDQVNVEITNMNIDVNKYNSADLVVDDLIVNKKEEEKKTPKKKSSKTKVNNRSENHRTPKKQTKNKNSNTNNSKKKSSSKESKNSKTTTNRKDN